MFRAALIGATGMVAFCGIAESQEALASEYGYKLASKTAQAAYFLSGIRRGSEPESVEAWVWTVMRAPEGAGVSEHDARAQRSVLRCTGRSIEALKTEYYLHGQVTRVVEEPPQTPADVKGGTPMEAVWNVACDMETRFGVETVIDIDHAYATARSG